MDVLTMSKPTEEYTTLQDAYDFLNTKLFDGMLPQCLITLQRKAKNNLGYFSPKRFSGRGNNSCVDELALNPDNFTGRSDQDIIGTLAHEMAHVWQEWLGKPSRNGYHNAEWGAKMKEIGLYPSNTGEVGGKETGQQMHHYFIPGGAFLIAWEELAVKGFRLEWQSAIATEADKAKKLKKPSKVKYFCPVCSQIAWAKPNALLKCGRCDEQLVDKLADEGDQDD
jgi:predicted SprT family Zn-dependent metalloprotease